MQATGPQKGEQPQERIGSGESRRSSGYLCSQVIFLAERQLAGLGNTWKLPSISAV